ncbi:TonB-dependent receptor plug domain-containing protein [Sulfuricurvum sp.]|uniref:TonB-dependent receptor plug domain-containing protein n=1 Tax=Sulfuricurvum sp. TaxID=2025608 RepID=UPI002D384BA0|nr:TonB-dependent receptor [Sulfuricurvum sp.]HZF70422.1 TonB-dependent receptor [Sulfuricurvum sp.]
MSFNRIPSSFVLCICTSGLVYAQSSNPVTNSYLELLPIDTFVDSISLEELSELVVTDTKIAQSSRTATQNIQVLNHAEFERIGDNRRNIAELVQYTSGQFVNVLSRNDANWGSYAGLGAKYNTYMLDGLPIDSFADAMSLDPWAFERVEVQKGPASILYSNYMTMDFAGNESPLAGTTNFILKDKIDRPMSRIQIGAGSYNTQNARLYHQDKKGSLSYFIGANVERSDYTQYGQEGSWLQNTENPDYQKSKLYGKLSWAINNDQTLSLFFHHTDQNGDMGRPNRGFNHRYETLNLKYDGMLNNVLRLQIQGGWRNYDREFENDNYPTNLNYVDSSRTRQNIIPVDITLSYLHGDHSVLTFGSDAQWTHYETSQLSSVSTPQNDVKARSNSFFIQEKAILGEWVVRGGVRHTGVQHDYALLAGISPTQSEASWSQNLWNVGLRWNTSDTLSWYANTGTSFMTPSAKQVGGTITNPLTDSGQLPNGSLQSELGLGNDIGVEWHPHPALTVGVRAFYNQIDDAIVDNVVNTVPSQTQSFNAGKTVAKGVEIDLQSGHTETLEYFANFTYTDTNVQDSSNSDSDGSNIPFVPRYVGNIGMTTFLPWDITASGYFQRVGKYYDSTSKTSRSEFGNYHVFNAKLQKNIFRNSDYSINTLLDLNNITDRRYSMPWGFVDPGFNAFASVAITF